METYRHAQEDEQEEEDLYDNMKVIRPSSSSECQLQLPFISSFMTAVVRRPISRQLSMDEEAAVSSPMSAVHSPKRPAELVQFHNHKTSNNTSRPLSEEAAMELSALHTIDFGDHENDYDQYQNHSPSSGSRTKLRRFQESLRESFAMKPLDPEEYAQKRLMTAQQERMNALTMLPPSIYCILFVFLTSNWIRNDALENARRDYYADPKHFETTHSTGFAGMLNEALADPDTGCLSPDFVFPAIPPLAVLAVFVGTLAHMPWSFVYHWYYAHRLHGQERINHWSRRMDQAMIHCSSAFYAYATSGSFHYFLACALFNLHCARRHFLPILRPRSNQIRIGIAMVAYSLPILRRGDVERFCILWGFLGIGVWLFSKYPIGGWSHAAFHLILSVLPAIFFSVALELPVSQPQIQLAAQCSVLTQLSHSS